MTMQNKTHPPSERNHLTRSKSFHSRTNNLIEKSVCVCMCRKACSPGQNDNECNVAIVKLCDVCVCCFFFVRVKSLLVHRLHKTGTIVICVPGQRWKGIKMNWFKHTGKVIRMVWLWFKHRLMKIQCQHVCHIDFCEEKNKTHTQSRCSSFRF